MFVPQPMNSFASHGKGAIEVEDGFSIELRAVTMDGSVVLCWHVGLIRFKCFFLHDESLHGSRSRVRLHHQSMLMDEAGPLLDEATEKSEEMNSSVMHIFAIRVSISGGD
ncbi:hypothetical protein VNO80_03037 [Phaseolus coccineus]|uniref:Uncharacterized protein n=1 Tax=Phaseolus coccineus TaxID=3886 RepID=A0AAN9NQK4_PHACN